MKYGEPYDEKMAEAIQAIEDDETGDMVVGFVAIAKIKKASEPDATAYRAFYGGDPDVLVGLSVKLADQTREWLRTVGVDDDD